MRYYKATVVRGHQGRGIHNGVITFYFQAKNAVEAMDLAKRQGGVKHSRLPLNCQEVTMEEYQANIVTSAYARAHVPKWETTTNTIKR